MSTENRLALVGATVIDGTGREPLPNAVVLIEGKAVQSVRPKARARIPKDYQTIDVSGKTVMPGMFDAHIHISSMIVDVEKRLFTPPTLLAFQTAAMMKRTLYAGFTTIRDAGGIPDVGYRLAVEQGVIEGPRMILAGMIGQTGGHLDEYYPAGVDLNPPGLIADGVPAVQKAARNVLRKGFDFVKVCSTGGVVSPADAPEYTEWTMEELLAIVHEARARGKAVMSHSCSYQGIKNAIRAGIWSVEHGSMLDDECIDLFLKHGTYFVPTLYIVEDIAARGPEMGVPPVSMEKIKRLQNINRESFRRAAAAGVKIAAGSDIIDEGSHGKNAGELAHMVENGFTAMQAIVAATKTASEACRVDHIVGTLAPGKMADILVVDGNPLDDVKILQDQNRLLVVMKEGKKYVDRLG